MLTLDEKEKLGELLVDHLRSYGECLNPYTSVEQGRSRIVNSRESLVNYILEISDRRCSNCVFWREGECRSVQMNDMLLEQFKPNAEFGCVYWRKK